MVCRRNKWERKKWVGSHGRNVFRVNWSDEDDEGDHESLFVDDEDDKYNIEPCINNNCTLFLFFFILKIYLMNRLSLYK